MLTATMDWILLIQIVITIIIFLWGYDRFSKRWSTTLGRYSVDGSYTRVDYMSGEGGASYMVSYGYTVDGKRYFGAINRSILSMSLLVSIEENVEKLQKEYLTGRTVRVFYCKESPSEHWINSPPSQGLNLHLADFAIRLNQFLAHLNAQFQRKIGSLHGDHRFM